MNNARLGSQRGRLSRIGTILSQLTNVLLFNGHPDETISGRAYRMGVIAGNPVWLRRMQIIDALFFWEEEHCRASHEEDLIFARAIITIGETLQP